MRGWQVLFLAVVAGTLGLATRNVIAEGGALALLLVFLQAVLYRLVPGAITCRRRLGSQIVPWGGALTEHVTFSNAAPLLAASIRVIDYSTLPQHPKGYVSRLPARRSLTWDIQTPCRMRGRYTVGPIAVTTSDPLGLFPITQWMDRAASVLVLPRWVALSRCAFLLDGLLPGEERGVVARESSSALAGIRVYQPGDPLAKIHWRASARAHQLMTKQFDPEVKMSLWVALDLDGDLSHHVEELLVTVATSLAMYALQQASLEVGVFVSGVTPVTLYPARDRAQQRRIQETLAEAHARRRGTTHLDMRKGRRVRDQRDQLTLHERLASSTTLHRGIRAGHVLLLVTAHGLQVWESTLALFRQRGVAVRVAHVVPGAGEARTQGVTNGANQTNRANGANATTGMGEGHEVPPSEASEEQYWPIPAIALPDILWEVSQEAALTERLESGGSAERTMFLQQRSGGRNI